MQLAKNEKVVKYNRSSHFNSQNYPIINLRFTPILVKYLLIFRFNTVSGAICSRKQTCKVKSLAMHYFFNFTLKANDQKQKQTCYFLTQRFLQTFSLIPYNPLKYLIFSKLWRDTCVIAMFTFSASVIFIFKVYVQRYVT